jgi:putative heme iron utilization protein
MFETIAKYAAGITAIVAVGTFLVTNIRSFIEYSRQNSLKRFEKYTELAGNWAEDKNIQMIIKLLDEDPTHKLRTLPFESKRAFLEFYEDIAIMRYSGLMKKRIAYYMFGFYTIRCYDTVSE